MNTVEGPCLLGYALQFTINSLKFLEKLFNKPVYALLGKVHVPKFVPQGTLVQYNMVKWSMSLGNISHYIT